MISGMTHQANVLEGLKKKSGVPVMFKIVVSILGSVGHTQD